MAAGARTCGSPWVLLLCLALAANSLEEVLGTKAAHKSSTATSDRKMMRERKMKEEKRARRVKEMMSEPPLFHVHAPAPAAATDWAQVLQAASLIAYGMMAQQAQSAPVEAPFAHVDQPSVGLQQELGSGAGEDAAPSDHTLQTTKPTEPVKTTVESSISGAIWGDEAYLQSMIKGILLAIALAIVTAALIMTRYMMQRNKSEVSNEKRCIQVHSDPWELDAILSKYSH